MPIITEPYIADLIRNHLENLPVNIDSDTRKLAQKQSEEYFQNNHQLVDNPIPNSLYHIIRRLSEDEQINFIKTHIDFIEKHDQEIFLYDFLSPESLPYFFSSKVFKVIHDISPILFKKILNHANGDIFYGFSHQDYLKFYQDYITELSQIDNQHFINLTSCHKHYYFKEKRFNIENGLIDLTKEIDQQTIYDFEFLSLIIKKYSHKITTFSSSELLSFINQLDDSVIINNFINDYYHQLMMAISNISTTQFIDIIGEYNSAKQKIILDKFYNTITKYHPFPDLIDDLNSTIIVDLCIEHPELLSFLTIEDWLKISTYYPMIDKKITSIFDKYELTDPQILFENINSRLKTNHPDYRIIKYLELKYRNNLKPSNCFFKINDKTSLFSKEFIHNLIELHHLIKTHQINKNDDLYQQHLLIFINYLKNKRIIDNPDDSILKIIDTVFYRIVKGAPLSDLYQIYSIEGLAVLSRLGKIPFTPTDFTVNQILNYNVKHHKQLTNSFRGNNYLSSYQTLSLKLMLLVGYNHAKVMLSINDSLPVLEHLVGHVNIENITFDKQGNPILNQKIINLLFNDRNYTQIKDMLNNQDSDLYRYFPRIFNEWENLKINHKDISLKSALGYLKGDNVTVTPEYYRLEGLFRYIGSTPKIINETLKRHDEMLARTISTIPRVTGTKGEYSYEILKLNNMEGLTVGNQTNCCFTIFGASSSSLKHATTNPSGRIFVIKKDNQIVAHSWLWRNGDLLCFDNIEVAKDIQIVDFFDVYLDAISKIINISSAVEPPSTCIKNITIGQNSFDKPVVGLDKYLCLKTNYKNLDNNRNILFLEKLPSPAEQEIYLDSKYTQYLITGTTNFKLGEITPCYQDERNNVMHYEFNQRYSEDYLKNITKRINSLTYIKAKQQNQLNSYCLININDIQELYCNDDWYYIVYKNGQTDEFIYSYDDRANQEMKNIQCQLPRVKKRIKH